MRVLLDECLPRGLKKLLEGHEVQTVPEAGWSGKENGELLGLLVGRFDAFITIDKNIANQQNLAHVSFGVVVLNARSNRLADLEPIMPKVLNALAYYKAGDLERVGG
jgi:hypothetical protein